MTRTPNRGGIVASQFAIISLAFCFLAAFTFRCTLDIDGHGNVGDETMTAALTSNLALGSLPPYGYRPDGTPWTWGVNTAPVYSWFYSPAVRLTSPLRRIEAARLVSRALGALTLFLLAVGLLQLVARSPLGAIPLPAQVGLLVFTVLALVNSPRFRFIASFARVDVLGLAFLTAVIAAASRVVLRPRALSVFLFVLLSLSVAWTSYIAFFLVGFIAAATLLICATQFIQVPLMAGARRLMLEIILPSVGAALLFVALSASLHGALFSGPASGVASTIAAKFSWTPTTRPQLQALERPERGWFLNAALIGFLVVAAKAAIQASPQESRDHRPMESVPRLVRDLVPLGIAVGMSTVIYRVWLITLPIRFTYDVMIVTAFAALQLIVFGFILRSRPIDRYIMSGAVLVALLRSSLFPWGLPGMAWFLCREDADLVKGRLWPVSSVLVGLYNPFDETRDVGNLARSEHGDALLEFLHTQGITKALATDPMFGALSNQDVTFYFLNDSGASTPSPRAEELLLTHFVDREDVRYLVSTELGESEPYERTGAVEVRRCLRMASASKEGRAVCNAGARHLELQRVFSSDAVVKSTAKYAYDTEASTPMRVYRLHVSPR